MEFAKLLLTGTQADIPAFYEEARRFFLAFPKAGDELLQRNREELSASVPFLGEHAAAFLLLVWRDHNEVRARFFSDTGKVRALEFLNALFSEMGLVKGNSADAAAQISQTLLWTQIREREQGD
ncbi:MAG: hypothetical protein IJV04_04265, partial [Lachnospiraceae bacterium]|nr:hypothetical protein [Lachnospiraceae bacterium]